MRRAMKMLVLAVAVAAVYAPASARAEGYVNPWTGLVFGNDTAQKGFHSFGVSLGDTGGGSGLDINFGYSPKFFGDTSDTKVLDLMGGVTLGPRVGSSSISAKPYAVVGVGLLRTSNGSAASNDFGFNVGGGVFGYFSTHAGLRGELRYYRTLNGTNAGDFHFVRAQLGLVLR